MITVHFAVLGVINDIKFINHEYIATSNSLIIVYISNDINHNLPAEYGALSPTI